MIYSHMRHENRNKTIWKEERRKREWRATVNMAKEDDILARSYAPLCTMTIYMTMNIFYLIHKRKKEGEHWRMLINHWFLTPQRPLLLSTKAQHEI